MGPQPGSQRDRDLSQDDRIRVVHVLGHPTRPLDVDRHPEDAQVHTCRMFCDLLNAAGIPCIYYGVDGSKTAAGEIESVGAAPTGWEYGNDWHKTYNERLSEALERRLLERPDEPQVVASLYGCAHADIELPASRDVPVVEPMVGYDHCWAPYRVFPSYAHQHVIYADPSPHIHDTKWFDTVIPHFLHPEEYEPARKKGDYALFLGRHAPDKGWQIAEEVCERAGIRLKRIHSGLRGGNKSQIIKQAIAVFVPTLYVEPFGYVAIEAQLCGVPVITTDWGAFAETVVQGVTGFRCRTFAEFTLALHRAPCLDGQAIRLGALETYSLQAVLPAYTQYLAFVWQVHRHGGYYAENAVRFPFNRFQATESRPAQQPRSR